VADSSAVPWKKRRRRDNRFMEKKAAVLTAAAGLFNRQGFENTPLSDLADALNVTKPTLYYYVSSKDELLLEISRTAQAAYLEALDHARHNGSTGRERLELFISRYVQSNCTDFGRVTVKTARQSLSPGSQREMNAEYRKLDSLLRNIFQEGQDDGTLAAVDPKMATFLLFGAMNWVAYWFEEDGELTPEDVARQFTEILFSGFAPR
jgi:AcrR family transcriptional regulator